MDKFPLPYKILPYPLRIRTLHHILPEHVLPQASHAATPISQNTPSGTPRLPNIKDSFFLVPDWIPIPNGIKQSWIYHYSPDKPLFSILARLTTPWLSRVETVCPENCNS